MIDTVLLKVASRCNLNCTYCYVYNLGDDGWKKNPKNIDQEIIDNIVQSLTKLYQYQGKSFAVVLHGGEPFLLPKQKLEYLLSLLRKNLPDYTTISIQTNGMLLTDELITLCHKYKTTISISLDGPEHIHDSYRLNKVNKGSFHRVMNRINLIKEHKYSNIFTGCLAVIDPYSDPKEIYQFFKSLNLPSVNFLLRDGNHDRLPFGKISFYSTEYGLWLQKLWNEYFHDENPVPIAIFDNILKLIMGGESSKEGTGLDLSEILIIDTNGEITKNDTLKSTQNGADRFKYAWNVKDDDIIELINSEEFKTYAQLQNPTSEDCLSCQYINICGGGMPLYRWSEKNNFNNPSIYCNDHKHIIKSIYNTVSPFL